MADQKAFSEIRHEVYKFGLQGFDKKVQVNARYEQAIKLGAKPKSWIKPHNNRGDLAQQTEAGQKNDNQQPNDIRYQQQQSRKPRKEKKSKQRNKTHTKPLGTKRKSSKVKAP